MKVKCLHCETIFSKKPYEIKRSPNHYCSRKCWNSYESCHKTNKIIVICAECGATTKRRPKSVQDADNNFCSRSCSVSYNNKNKSKGTKRSKLEYWIENQLTSRYPTIDIHFNQKDAIDSELDIYVPSLKLAFELNGIFHYEPIFGKDKLSQIQNNDNRKFQACLDQEIELCIIDTSQQKYFKPKSSQRFLDIICNIIDTKL